MQGKSSADGATQVEESAQQALNKGTFECVICLGRIAVTDTIYACCECGNCVHFTCCQRWAKKVPEVTNRIVRDEFPCPACQTWQPVPSEPRCFCGKARLDRQKRVQGSSAHACGRRCGRRPCIHGGCPRFCHPGPCAPCPGTVEVPCCCGRETVVYRCAEYRKKLAEGTTERPSCDRPCGYEKPCGHVCRQRCHPPDAHNGKDVSDQEPCEETVWTKCAVHSNPLPVRCPGVRHVSAVVCTEILGYRCRCGAERFSLTCIDLTKVGFDPGVLLCDRVCGKLLSCHRHRCNKRCCSDTQHICAMRCNRIGGGRRASRCPHPCPLPCHSGPCPSCTAVSHEALTCACGRHQIEPPVPCGTLPPVCNAPCQKPRPCGHPCALGRCHQGECPKCLHLVLRECVGGHKEHRQMPCSTRSFRCFRACNQLLPCGRHRCRRRCHDWRNPDDPCSKGDAGHHCEMPMAGGQQICVLRCGHEGAHQGGTLTTVRPSPSVSEVSVETEPMQTESFMRSDTVSSDLSLNTREHSLDAVETSNRMSIPQTNEAVIADCASSDVSHGGSGAMPVPPRPSQRHAGHTDKDPPFSAFLLEMAREHWEEFIEFERVVHMVALGKHPNWHVRALDATSPRMRAAQHELASVHYKLHSHSAGTSPDRHVVVAHQPGVSRVPQTPLTDAIRQQDECAWMKKHSRASRCLAVRLSPFAPVVATASAATSREPTTTSNPQCVVQSQQAMARLDDAPSWSKDFQAHAGNYSIIARNVHGFDIIEFSTPERCQSAWLSLRFKRHIIAAKVSEQELEKLNPIASTERNLIEDIDRMPASPADDDDSTT
ncbi:Nuclear transcription factor, X-box [Cyanidiococcus yangmingshanensis]|uniref:Nuclear transcription factor, X-box n=1 Tax=Cyanidiococcus yangmingshanensis TaxID=2690220 RepID=A0A7J7ICG9_9RHOD|nr:Nuclear transcription factor, X-box [Cyanidiococcus yangmingshanensis]